MMMKLSKKGVAWYYLIGLILGLVVLGVILYMATKSGSAINDLIGRLKDVF